jgi:adenine-specific DNA-methyltransferase
MSYKQRLELDWVGKDSSPNLEPRILIKDNDLSNDRSENCLIHGDNLLALKALEPNFNQKIKCIYIDPPYNTGAAFKQYDDGLEHSLWLSLMRDRLIILKNLLREDGAIFVHIDDNEGHYLKVLMDEIFGRSNFVTNFIWQKVDSPNDNKVPITPDHEFILCYAKDKTKVHFNQKADESVLSAYRVDEDGRRSRDRLLKKNGRSSLREDRPTMFYPIKAPNGEEILPIHDDGREACWAMGKKSVERLIKENKLIWKNRGTDEDPRWVPYTREYAPENPSRPYPTIWTDVHTMRQAKSHQKKLLPNVEIFATPKPEPLMKRIIEMATSEGDWVLDSFAGSGTTGAVAHKMKRKWIMVELGAHCFSHIVPRLQKVISGEDSGGVTEEVSWTKGGGFTFFRLAPSLLNKDDRGNWVINNDYNAFQLAEAVCRHEKFNFFPDETVYWKQGYSSEKDFIFVTTQFLTSEHLDRIEQQMSKGETLLVCAKAFRVKKSKYPNITLKKIPQMLLGRCEFGKDDYSLNIKEEVQEELNMDMDA